MTISWNPNLSVGVAKVDAHHRKLIDMINQVAVSVEALLGPQAVGQTIDQLIEYTQYHFTFEEDLLEQNDYPGLAEHRQEHQRLILEVEKLKNRFAKGATEKLRTDTMKSLTRWLIEHIEGEDQKYAEFLNLRGGALSVGGFTASFKAKVGLEVLRGEQTIQPGMICRRHLISRSSVAFGVCSRYMDGAWQSGSTSTTESGPIPPLTIDAGMHLNFAVKLSNYVGPAQ